MKYVQSLQLIEDLIYILNLNAADEKQMIGELQKWRKNGNELYLGVLIDLICFSLITVYPNHLTYQKKNEFRT